MPWAPELFSAPALQRLLDRRRREELVAVPFYYGLVAGEIDALVESFAGEPELHDPMHGRVKGVRAFEAYVGQMAGWFAQEEVSVETIDHVILGQRGFEEAVLHFVGEAGPVALPVAVVAERTRDARIRELRIYYSTWQLTGRHADRPPVLHVDPGLLVADAVGDYLGALAAGDLAAAVAAFEPDGYVREPSSPHDVHIGREALRAFHEGLLPGGGGIRLDSCAVADDLRTCAVECNVVGWGSVELAPQAGVAVFVRGESGRLAAVRRYDDVDVSVTLRG